MPTRIQTINKATPYVSLNIDANQELDGFFDFLFDGHLSFANATKINRDVSLVIDNLPITYSHPTRVLGWNNFAMNILGYGVIQYSLLYDTYGKKYVHIFSANFGYHRPYISSTVTNTKRMLVQQSPKIEYVPISEESYGYKIGYNKEVKKYNILNNQNKPISKDPMQKKPRFFKSPFGKYQIIAHCNIGGCLWAMDINGKFYFMHRMWKDAYLYEVTGRVVCEMLQKQLINEERKHSNVVIVKESQLRDIIRESIKKVLLSA